MPKITIGGHKLQVRINTRMMVEAQILDKNVVIASGQAVCNPVDGFDNDYGRELALNRALIAAAFRVKVYDEIAKAAAGPGCPCFACRWYRLTDWLGRNKRRILAGSILLLFMALCATVFIALVYGR
jgi:hypothetical protein